MAWDKVDYTRTCNSCGSEFAVRPKEKKSAFDKRRHCDNCCPKYVFTRKTTDLVKNCMVCDKGYTQRTGEKLSRFLARKTCSPECYHARGTSKPVRHCVTCGSPIQRSDHKKYCSKACIRKVFNYHDHEARYINLYKEIVAHV